MSGGEIIVDPDVTRAKELSHWWKSSKSTAFEAKRLTRDVRVPAQEEFHDRKCLLAISDKKDDISEYMTFRAYLYAIKSKASNGDSACWYSACPNEKIPCRNLFTVTQDHKGQWYCNKCHQTYGRCVRRYIVQASLIDDTSNAWVSIYNKHAESLFGGVRADQSFQNISDTGSSEFYDRTIDSANFSEWIFTVRIEVENIGIGSESRTKISVVHMNAIDIVEECKNMLDSL